MTSLLPEHALKLWHPNLNLPLAPENVTAGSNKRVWWLGECGHEWETTVSTVCYFETGCPYCNKGVVLAGFNDLATLKPDLVKQWDYEKNLSLTPEKVTPGSGKKVWWKCEQGHSVLAPVYKKVKYTGCGICSGKILKPGVNDLAALFPGLSKEYSNKNIKPSHLISPGSHTKVVWQCEKGHEWETTPKHRTRSKSNCPVCANQKIITGYNDLATTHPELILQLHPTLNPIDIGKIISYGHRKKLWWVCPVGHNYTSLITDKIRNECGICANQVTVTGVNDLASCSPNVAAEWHPTKNFPLLKTQVTPGSNHKVWWVCNECSHVWKTAISARKNAGCPACYHRNSVSQAEKTIYNYIKTLTTASITLNSRTIIPPQELDIFLENHNLAIEYNGIYWHTEKFKPRNYHYDKWKACKDKGIQLIQIWEDDWNRNPELIKRMLAHKLKTQTTISKTYARNTTIIQLNPTETTQFLTQNHIQGNAEGSIRIGLKEKTTNKIRAIMVLKKDSKNTLNLMRYATSQPTPGGFTKILTYIEKNYHPDRIITFSDNTISNGGLYENNGFTQEAELSPDYMYLVKNERKHKFGYRLEKFKNNPNLKYEEGLTERELAQLNNIPRIWDAGKIKWVKNLR